MRIAFTIIYEGLHHLKHKDFAINMCKMFDRWIVVEGHSLPYGSTKWCNRLDISPVSKDGTIEFMKELSAIYPNVHFYSKGDYYYGKDEQVNTAITILKRITNRCYLWEVDADEHWTEQQLYTAERQADRSTMKGFSFHFNQFVGDDIIATGEWGGNTLNRLWKWSGQLFRSHEPAMLHGQVGVGKIEDIRFDHYSYVFEKDVAFKSIYYPDHEYVLEGWRNLKEIDQFPVPISILFGRESKIGQSNSQIQKYISV